MRMLLISASLFLLSAPSFSAERRTDSTVHRASAPATTFGRGLTAVGVADTEMVTGGPSVSAMFSNRDDWIQTILGVYQTKGSFNFAAGGAYKFTIAGTRSTGFHVGPGFTLGTIASEFAFAVFGAAGGHFTMFDHFILAIDAGPMVTHTKDNTNFRLMPFGSMLGLSAHYVF